MSKPTIETLAGLHIAAEQQMSDAADATRAAERALLTVEKTTKAHGYTLAQLRIAVRKMKETAEPPYAPAA